MKSPVQSQPNRSSALLVKETQLNDVRPNRTPLKASLDVRAKETPAEAVRLKETQARELASELFDAALTAAQITSGEAAYLIGVSESVVRRMRSKEAREQVSAWQELLLPPSYHLAKFDVLFLRLDRPEGHVVRLLRALGSLMVLAR